MAPVTISNVRKLYGSTEVIHCVSVDIDNGVVEQIGATLEPYDQRKNLFVAGFIGSPGMNFIEGQVSSLDGQPVVMTDDAVLLPVSVASALLQHGQRVVYGIRPENISLEDDGHTAHVSVIEPTGSETQAFMNLEGSSLVGVFRERIALHPGERLGIRLNPGKTHLFDKASGQRLA